MYLENILSPADLKRIPISELSRVCEEIRRFLIHSVSRSGGHLASNLGSVELTVALHYAYNSPHDKFCWDVGHQCYPHKILTGRKEQLSTVRTWGGISGFPKREESEHDLYNTGHAGTAISQALGEAIARENKKARGESADYAVLAIIGDASIVSGMAFEAMNHAGYMKTPMLVILNDNEMSISRNVGALSYRFNSLINSRMYRKGRRRFFKFLKWIPLIGPIAERLVLRFNTSMKGLVTDHQFFGELGFRYLGPIDGHDVEKLVHIFQKIEQVDEPTLLHIVTKKGKGYELAEKDPIKYHGVSPFQPENGIEGSLSKKWPLSNFVGATLAKLGDTQQKICVITPAMKEGSGLVQFAERHPGRFYDAGIAEQHATTFAGALASAGEIPYLCIYSTFLQRGYDQLIHDITLMNFPVRLIIDRAGCVGGDGDTHQGMYDIAYMNPLPHITIFSPRNAEELVKMLVFSSKEISGAMAIRFPKRDFSFDFFSKIKNFHTYAHGYNPFFPETLKKGKDILIITEGPLAENALLAAEILRSRKISSQVVDIKCIKPLNQKKLAMAMKGKKAFFSVENHVTTGGMGQIIRTQMYSVIKDTPFMHFAYPENPVEHGSIKDVERKYGLDGESIALKIADYLKKNRI